MRLQKQPLPRGVAMMYLSELLGAPVYDASGKRVGKVAELGALPAAQPPRVSTLIVGTGRSPLRFVSWDQVASVEEDKVKLRVSRKQLLTAAGDESYLPLRKGLLDQQVIDVHGRKVVRVNDLLLDNRTLDGGTILVLAAVDIGLRGAVRRLLQGAIPRPWLRQIESRVSQTIIPWNFVDLIQDDPRHQVKLHISHEVLTHLHPADLADIMEQLSPKERKAIFAALDNETVADALSEIRPELRASILESLGLERAAGIVEEMSPDAAADLLADLPEETTSELLQDMNVEEAAELGELLEFPENSAGGLMNTEYVALPHTADVEAARNLLKSLPDLPEHFTTLYLVDEAGTLVGSVPVARLVVAELSDKLVDLKSEPLVSVPQEASQKDVVDLFDKYNLLSLPVIDHQHHLVGAVTVDDVVTVLYKKH